VETPRLIQQRGERSYLPDVGSQVSFDEGVGRRTRGIIHECTRYHTGTPNETVVLVVPEFFGP
jgi:hypothetical protein